MVHPLSPKANIPPLGLALEAAQTSTKARTSRPSLPPPPPGGHYTKFKKTPNTIRTAWCRDEARRYPIMDINSKVIFLLAVAV